jgi:hypothetical protein
MKNIAHFLKVSVQRILEAQDPIEDKPSEIFAQVRPLLIKMGLSNMTDRSKVGIIEGQTQGDNSLYRVVLRRQAQITSDTIDRIKRNEAYLNLIQWSAKAMEVQVWWPYESPSEKAAPVQTRPGVPKMPTAIPSAPPI